MTPSKKKQVSKKKITSTKPKAKTQKSWHEKAQELLDAALKSNSNRKGRLVLLSSTGDLIVEAGQGPKLDLTSSGALVSAVRSVSSELDDLMNTKTNVISFGTVKEGYWIECLGDWLLIGVRVPVDIHLTSFRKHIKKREGHERNLSEALEGLSEAAVDAAFKK